MATLVLTPDANLVSCVDAPSYVTFHGARYQRDDIVPGEIFPFRLAKVITQPYLIPKTAGDFVIACMVDQFDQGKEWPSIAQEFLWPVGKRAEG